VRDAALVAGFSITTGYKWLHHYRAEGSDGRLLEGRGLLDEDAEPKDTLASLQAESVQASLPFQLDAERPRHRRRAGFHDGFSLHAGVSLHANDREGLERLARYGARPPFALDRLSLLPDGSVCYRLRRPVNGAEFLMLEPVKFLRRLASLVPPRRPGRARVTDRPGPRSRRPAPCRAAGHACTFDSK
jgi:hypothetical protein